MDRAAEPGGYRPGSTTPVEPTRTYVTATPSRSSWRAGVQHRRMLNGRGHDVLLCSFRMPHHAEKSQIIGLRAAAREHDVLRLAAHQRRRLAAGRLQPLLGQLPEMVDTGRVTVHFGQTP